MSGTPAEMVSEFHAALQRTPDGKLLHLGNVALRCRLHHEEHSELIDALRGGNVAAIAQELADVVYVAYGTADALGIPLDAVLAEVHAANMRKFGAAGAPALRDDGKVTKPKGWRPPDVAETLNRLRA